MPFFYAAHSLCFFIDKDCMSVFTTVSFEQLQSWLSNYDLGELLSLKGIASGITNTNYFVTTSKGSYVLTLFEEHSADELVYFMQLMTHLALHGIPCPHPVARLDGYALSELNGKPAALVSRLRGSDVQQPTQEQCAQVGKVLAGMHLASIDFKGVSNNTRDASWRSRTAHKVMSKLSLEEQALLQQAIALDVSLDISSLPQGVIHADLFRDNVLFDGEQLGGLIDFYYACTDAWLYDVAIAVNDWCVEADGALDPQRLQAMLQAYQAVRPLQPAELSAWPGLLQRAALRFWLSRLHDKYFPLAGEMTHAKDPDHFKRILQQRMQTPAAI